MRKSYGDFGSYIKGIRLHQWRKDHIYVPPHLEVKLDFLNKGHPEKDDGKTKMVENDFELVTSVI